MADKKKKKPDEPKAELTTVKKAAIDGGNARCVCVCMCA